MTEDEALTKFKALKAQLRRDGGVTPEMYQRARNAVEKLEPTMEDLIEASSFGTAGAKALRARTPQHVVDEITRRIDAERLQDELRMEQPHPEEVADEEFLRESGE